MSVERNFIENHGLRLFIQEFCIIYTSLYQYCYPPFLHYRHTHYICIEVFTLTNLMCGTAHPRSVTEHYLIAFPRILHSTVQKLYARIITLFS